MNPDRENFMTAKMSSAAPETQLYREFSNWYVGMYISWVRPLWLSALQLLINIFIKSHFMITNTGVVFTFLIYFAIIIIFNVQCMLSECCIHSDMGIYRKEGHQKQKKNTKSCGTSPQGAKEPRDCVQKLNRVFVEGRDCNNVVVMATNSLGIIWPRQARPSRAGSHGDAPESLGQ